jgi:hypothetical protein
MASLPRVEHPRDDDAASHLRLFWQMRLPQVELASDVSVALTAYLVNTAKGGEINAPGMKR